jgi:pimeloyl-ACP methyl ester carboxylesterase
MTQQASVNKDFKSDVTQLTWPLKLFVAALNGLDRLAPNVSTHLMLSKFVQPRRKKDCSYESRLPDGARRLAVQHNSQSLTGWAWGDSGPAILVLHGWESHTGRMLPLIKPLLAQGYRVFALDAPGHGLSPQARTHLLDVGEAIRAMMTQHGPFYGVIAHSFGAAATAVLLARHPELMPEKLVLLSPMRDLDQHLDIFARIAQLSP